MEFEGGSFDTSSRKYGFAKAVYPVFLVSAAFSLSIIQGRREV
jgi:hypothetical protein